MMNNDTIMVWFCCCCLAQKYLSCTKVIYKFIFVQIIHAWLEYNGSIMIGMDTLEKQLNGCYTRMLRTTRKDCLQWVGSTGANMSPIKHCMGIYRSYHTKSESVEPGLQVTVPKVQRNQSPSWCIGPETESQ